MEPIQMDGHGTAGDGVELFTYLVGTAPQAAQILGRSPETVDAALVLGMQLGFAVLSQMLTLRILAGNSDAATQVLTGAFNAADAWGLRGIVQPPEPRPDTAH